MAQKCLFPMKYVNISQTYKGSGHKAYWDGAKEGYKAYPIDICGMDSGRDYFYAPCDCKITFLEVKNSSNWTNKMILVSTSKVQTPKYGTNYVYFKVVHFLYSDVKKYGLKVGKTFKQGEIVCAEGKDNYSTGNHLHVESGIGQPAKNVSNGNGKLVCNGDGKYPESIFYLDKTFYKKIINLNGLNFTMI